MAASYKTVIASRSPGAYARRSAWDSSRPPVVSTPGVPLPRGLPLAFPGNQRDDYQRMRYRANRGDPSPPASEDLGHSVTMPGDRRDLGLAVLIAETVEHEYEPIAIVSTIREAISLSREDLSRRCAELEEGREPLCPEQYVIWARTTDGAYRRVHAIDPADLMHGGPRT